MSTDHWAYDVFSGAKRLGCCSHAIDAAVMACHYVPSCVVKWRGVVVWDESDIKGLRSAVRVKQVEHVIRCRVIPVT